MRIFVCVGCTKWLKVTPIAVFTYLKGKHEERLHVCFSQKITGSNGKAHTVGIIVVFIINLLNIQQQK